jgi:AcrR family transcriptional regulator
LHSVPLGGYRGSVTITSASTPAPRDGLRERHRKRTLAQLEEVALRLFAERGFDAVTIDDIAAEAEVARRTFFRYFASKDDVLFADHHHQLDALRQALAARPVDEPPLTALRRAILSMADSYEEDRERLLHRARILAATPSLRGRGLDRQRAGEQAVTDLVAEWLGVDPTRDLRPAIVAATTLAALRVAVNTWLSDDGKAHLPTLAAEALDLLDGGLQHCVTRAKPPRRKRNDPLASDPAAGSARRRSKAG